MATSANSHDERVASVCRDVKRFYDRKEKFRIYHGTTNSTRRARWKRSEVVDTSGLNHVLSVDVDFVHMGGNSLLAGRATSRIRAVTGVQIPSVVMYQLPTVAKIAGWLHSLDMPGPTMKSPAFTPSPSWASWPAPPMAL